mgnify:CR=1 FL=1
MSKILVSFFLGTGEDKLLNFYEGFLDSLKTAGNDVQYIVTNNFLDTPWNGENNLKKNHTVQTTMPTNLFHTINNV